MADSEQVIYGIPVHTSPLLPDCCVMAPAGATTTDRHSGLGHRHNIVRMCLTGEHTVRTIRLDVNVSVPVSVVQDAMATRALELLKRDITRAAKKAVEDFIANGITGELEKLSVTAEKSLIGAK